MGGELEQKVPQEAPKTGETVAQTPPLTKTTLHESPGFVETATTRVPGQTLRFHISGGEVHFHEDALKLKAALSVADYYTILRRVQMLEKVSYMDAKLQSLITFAPYREGDNVEVCAEICFARPGKMLSAMLALKK